MLDDLISRQDAIAIATQEGAYGYISAQELAEMPSAQRWIPCSERLPEYGIRVLTTDKDGNFELNHIIDEDDGEWFWNGAIAWMPLPEPWKGEE